MRHRAAVVGLVLVATGAALWLGDHWMSSTPTPGVAATRDVRQTVELPARLVESTAREAAASTAPVTPAPAPAEVATFRGRVFDAVTRQPVREFEISLRDALRAGARWEPPKFKQTFQSRDGRFASQQAPVGNWNVAVAAQGYQRFQLDNLIIAAGDATRGVVVPLRRGQTVKGRVFDQISGAGLGDAYVTLRYQRESPMQMDESVIDTRSRADGTFVLDGAAAGDAIISAVAKGHASCEVPVFVREDLQPIELGLVTGAKVAGMVVAADGTPASGTIGLTGGVDAYGYQLDETGAFSIAHLPAGRYRLSAHSKSGNAGLEFELAENEVREGLVLTIGAGRSVRGVVTGLRPEQFERAHISLQSAVRRTSFVARPDAHGAFVVAGVPPGRGSLTVHVDGSRRLIRPIEVPADADIVLNIVVPPGVRLSGRVTRQDRPIAAVNIWAGAADGTERTLYGGTTRQDGHYEIEGVVPGEYRVTVQHGTSQVVAIAGDTVVNFDLPLVQLGGRVLEDGSTIPVVGAVVRVVGIETQTASVSTSKISDHAGQFSLLGIDPGEVLLTVYKPGYEMHREKLSYSSPITNRIIKLRKSDGVEVRVQFAAEDANVRQLYMQEQMPGNIFGLSTYIALDRNGVGSLPSALSGSTLHIQSAAGKTIVIEAWNGEPLDLEL